MATVIINEKLLADVFKPIKEKENIFSLQAEKKCSLKDFVKNVVNYCFGMGVDYLIKNNDGKLLKSWFTVKEAIEAAKSLGYDLDILDAGKYLDYLVMKGYFETRDGVELEYRRRVFLALMDLSFS